MHRLSTPARSSLPRLLLTLWLAFAVLLQPVLSALGEVHEAAAHAASGADLHPDHAQPHDDPHGVVPPHDGPSEDGGVLHVLLHVAHCCGYSMGLAIDASIAPAMRIDAARLLPPVSVRRPGAHLTSPFRPPISA